MSASAARRCAHAVLARVFDEGAFADVAFRAEAERMRLDPRERAFAQQLAYGAVQRRATLDHLIAGFSSRPPDELDARVRDALRLGLLQLLFLDGVADHAAVSESVELAKGRGGDRLANAVLRRAQREGPGWPFAPGLIAKSGPTGRFLGISPAERRRIAEGELRAALSVPEPERVVGRRILVLDDVYSEGFSLREMARVLTGAGAAEVAGLVFARRKGG